MSENTSQNINTEETKKQSNPEVNSQSDAVRDDIQKVKSLIQKIKDGIKEKRQLAKESKQSEEVVVKKSLFSGNKKLIIALVVFLILIVLLIAASLYKSLSNSGNKTEIIISSPTPVANVSVTPIQNPSKYATDSAVLQMESKIKELDTQLNSNIKESGLSLPSLDFDIKF